MQLKSISDVSRAGFDEKQADLRNFEVRSRPTDERLGTVDDVLIDRGGDARYFCVRHADQDRHTLLPFAEADAERTNRTVWTRLLPETFRDLPAYSHQAGLVDDDYERRLTVGYDRSYTNDSWYDRPDYQSTGWGSGNGRPSSGRVERLDRLADYKIAEGEVDPHGWPMTGREGRTLGKVDHLVADTGSMRIRYLGVKLEGDVDPERREVLIPIGHVDLDTAQQRVTSRAFEAACMRGFPAWNGQSVTREDEQQIVIACDEVYTGDLRYEHPRYRINRAGATTAAAPHEGRTSNG